MSRGSSLRARFFFILAALALGLSACAPATPAPGPTASPTPVVVEKVVTPTPAPRPREFVLGTSWEVPPAYHGNPFAPGGVGGAWWFVFQPLLIYVPATGEAIPSLAESFEEAPDRITFRLRQTGWSDGTPFTSKDVWASFVLMKLMWNWPGEVDRVETPDERTAVIVWKQPLANPKALISSAPILVNVTAYGKFAEEAAKWLGQTGAEAEEALNKIRQEVSGFKPEKPIAIGPFQVESVSASEMILTKNPHHYAAKNIGIDRIRFLRWTSNEVMWAFHLAGELDASHAAAPKDVADQILQRQPKTRLQLVTDLSEFALLFNLRKAPFNDVRFRKAIAYLIDRDKVREISYYAGLTSAPYSHGVLKSFEEQWLGKDFLGSLTAYNLDPAKAEALLKEMGWTKGPDGKWRDPTGKAPEFEILAQAGATDWILAAEAIATQLNKQGFQVRTRTVEPGVYPTTLRGGQFDMAIQFGSAWWGTAHPLTGYYRLYQGEAAEFTGAKDVMATMKGPQGEDVNIAQALDSLLKEPNPERQKAIVRQLAWITNENLPVLSLLEKQLMIFHVDGVRVTGWPAANDPLWTVAPGAIERFYAHLLIQGILKPAP